jgi:glycosyltransferase involved in cell wall biosynthesis
VGTRKLLILSYLFPPAGGVAVQRALSLSRYLPECGFEVHVLHARNAAAPVRDPGLLAQVPAGVRIHSAFTPELPFGFRQKVWNWLTGGKRSSGPTASESDPGRRAPLWKRLPVELVRRLLCPEPEILWVPFALRAARRIVRRHNIDTVLVTVPPFSALVAASALKREFPHLKLVTDFRDDWLRFYLGEFDYQRNAHIARRAASIEREAVERSDLAVVVTRSMLADIRARYPDQDSRKFVFIPNGYEPDNIPARGTGAAARPVRSKIVVSFIGTVYSASSARYYLDALENLPEDLRAAVETRFVGRVADSERAYLENRNVAIRTYGFMPQSEALVHMAEADYLLLTMTDAASLTGKLFEYLATGKPILAVAPNDGEVARILHETSAGWCAAPDDRAGLQRLLAEAFANHRNGGNGFHPNWEAIRRYERPRLAAEFGKRIRDLS